MPLRKNSGKPVDSPWEGLLFQKCKGRNTMNQLTRLTVTTAALLCLVTGLPPVEAVAQEKQRASFKTSAENTKYTQRHSIEVGDLSGHHVRVYEIQRTFPNNAPVINGVALKEQWTRAISDYTDMAPAPHTVYMF